ncbi:regulator of G-protein signaling 19 isoform X3 [Neoarius graeffei]|uniref:regulator of G-protein signaling 19 isoform X3 n=1 Tax=Neoarius graeffei TaxID=443677 RepID=UPI00298C343D|nr:regulator of G-protein signaling 19 isoform X3 [Neoarius graeffei]
MSSHYHHNLRNHHPAHHHHHTPHHAAPPRHHHLSPPHSVSHGARHLLPHTPSHHLQYTGPVPAERESPMARSEMSPSRAQHSPPTQRPNACCFCWCCCCSCSCLTIRREDESRRRLKAQETKLETIPNCEPCTKPTVEEMKQWAQSFDKLMKNPAGRNVFREFLRTEYSEENMLFWLACEDLKKEINKNMIEEKARMIYEDYVSILSPKEVSLDSRVREVINRKMQDPTPHTFEDAQLQIYTLMHRDSYPRFLNSPIYRSLVQGGSRSSSES